MSSQPLPEDVRNALKAGRKVDAIRLLREQTGLGLAAAKAAVEADAMPATPQDFARGFDAVDAGQLPPAVRDALAAGNTLEAIRQLRQAKGLGLKEAKAAIDTLRSGPEPSGRAAPSQLAPGEVGHSGLNLWLWVALAAVVAVVAWRMLGA